MIFVSYSIFVFVYRILSVSRLTKTLKTKQFLSAPLWAHVLVSRGANSATAWWLPTEIGWGYVSLQESKVNEAPIVSVHSSHQPTPDFLNSWRLIGIAPQKDLEILALPHCRKWLGCFWGYHWCNSQFFWLIWILKSRWRTNICRRCTAFPANFIPISTRNVFRTGNLTWSQSTENHLIDDILMSKNLPNSSSYCLLLLGFVHPKMMQDFTADRPHPRPACNRRLAPRLVSRRWDNLKTSLVQGVRSRWERIKQNDISLYIHDITNGIVIITWKSWHSTWPNVIVPSSIIIVINMFLIIPIMMVITTDLSSCIHAAYFWMLLFSTVNDSHSHHKKHPKARGSGRQNAIEEVHRWCAP